MTVYECCGYVAVINHCPSLFAQIYKSVVLEQLSGSKLQNISPRSDIFPTV